MLNVPIEKITERLETIDPVLSDFIFSEGTTSLLEDVCKKYGLKDEGIFWVSKLTGLLVLRLITPQAFVNELATLISERYFNQFRQELEDKLFSPYDTYLHQAGVVYKQITKLEPKKVVEPEKPQAKPQATETILTVPPVSPVSTRVPQAAPQPNVVIIGEVQPRPETQHAKPATPLATAPAPLSAQQAARIKSASGSLPPGLAVQTNEPTPVRPEIKEVKFEVPQAISEIASEITAVTPEKELKVPKPPVIPKTQVQGKEVIDLTDFSVKQS